MLLLLFVCLFVDHRKWNGVLKTRLGSSYLHLSWSFNEQQRDEETQTILEELSEGKAISVHEGEVKRRDLLSLYQYWQKQNTSIHAFLTHGSREDHAMLKEELDPVFYFVLFWFILVLVWFGFFHPQRGGEYKCVLYPWITDIF